MKKITIFSVFALAAIGAQAQTYGEIGYTAGSYEERVNNNSLKSSPKAIRGLLGYELNENFAVEGIIGLGISSGSVQVNGQNIPGESLKIDHLYGLYVTPKAKLTDNLEGFFRAGFAHGKGTMSYNSQRSSVSESSFSYGAGVRYAFDKKSFLTVDYMSYFDKNNTKGTGLTVGIGSKF